MEEEAKKAAPKTEEEKVRDSFAAASGIQRNDDGSLQVDKTSVVKAPTGEEILE